jgi:hypothetical protein
MPKVPQGQKHPADVIGIGNAVHVMQIATGQIEEKAEPKPDPRSISTGFVETHNQKMRQHMRRFRRLTAGDSKKLLNHIDMVSLYTVWYKFARVNSSVRMAPAMAAGTSDRLWDVDELTRMVEAEDAAPKKRGPYKRAAEELKL